LKARTRRTRLVLGAFGALAVLLGVPALALALMVPPERLTPLVRDGLARALDAPVALTRARLAFVPQPAVRLEGVVIGDPRGYRRPAAWPRGGLAEAHAILANVDFGALFQRKVALTGLTFEDARVTLVRNEDGLGNWEALLKRKRSQLAHASPSFQLSLDGLALAPARFSWYDARDGAWFDVRRLEGKLALANSGGGRTQRSRFAARASGLGGRTPWPIGARPIELSADLDGRNRGADTPDWLWTVKKLGLKRGALELTGKGTITGPEQVLAFRLDQSRVPLSALLELLPADEKNKLGDLAGKGTVAVGLVAQGPLAHGQVPKVRARATMNGGSLAFKSRALAIEQLGFDVSLNEQGADLARLSGRVGRSVFQVSGLSRSWADPRLRAHVEANTDLADVQRFLPLPDSTRLAGRAAVKLDGAGPPDRRFGWSGTMALADVAARGLGLGYPVDGIRGTIGLSPGRAWASGLSARLGHSDVTIDGTIDRPLEFLNQALGKARVRDPGAVARFALASRSLDGDELFPARTDDSAMPRVRAEGSFKVGAFKLQKFAGTNLAGRLVYQDGVTSVSDIAFDAYGGHARGTAWFDFNDRRHPRYQVHGTADQVDANRLFSAWTPAKDVAFGTLQMTIDLDGTGLTADELRRSLSAKGIAQLLGGRLAGADVFAGLARFTGVDSWRILSFRDLSAPFHVTAGRVVFDPLALTSGQTDWLARGSVGLDGTLAFDVAALVPPSLVPALPSTLARVAGAVLDPSGRLTLDLKIGGTVRHPTLSWNSDRTASRLLERGPESLLALVGALGGSLQDSIKTGQSTIDAIAGALFDRQHAQISQEVGKEKEDLAGGALAELDRLFRQKSKPAPPPAADSTQVAPPDTTAGSAPPPAPRPVPEAGPPETPVLEAGPPPGTATPADLLAAPSASTQAPPPAGQPVAPAAQPKPLEKLLPKLFGKKAPADTSRR
jgi:uncharacterized protein involved in outer membrane biogenesis